MYLGDPIRLEININNDWSVLLKNLKTREDLHFDLLQHNKKLINKQRNQDTDLFINDQVKLHQQEYSRINELQLTCQQEQQEIIEKYEGAIVPYIQIMKLMGRVGARVLETLQSSIEKCKSFDQTLADKHHKTKIEIMKLINEKDRINLEEITNVVIKYGKEKLTNELEKLQQLIKGLVDGQYDKLKQIYIPKEKKTQLFDIKKLMKQKSVQKPRSISKQSKTPLKDQIKKNEIAKKQKQKFAHKLLNNLYSTLDLSKPQMMQEYCGTDKQKAQRMYNQMMVRNKFNHSQIIAFQSEKDNFAEKVRIFKELMELQSKKITEVLIRKPVKKEKNQQISQSVVLKNEETDEKIQELENIQKKMNSTRYRISSPKSKRQGKQIPAFFTSVYQGTKDNFDHFKFDTKNQQVYARTNRNKLPQINTQFQNISNSCRGTSLDTKIQINKERSAQQSFTNKKDIISEVINEEDTINKEKHREIKIKDDKPVIQRTKIIMKNIDVGVEGVLKKDQKPFGSKQKRKNQPSPMEYTFYVKKTGQRFFQPKNNVIF